MDMTSLKVSAADLAPITDVFTTNAGIILPVGIGLIAAFAGLRLIPKLIKTFTKG